MSRATPQMREFAERLIAYEMRETNSSATETPVVFRICGAVHPHLSMLMGRTGFHALLSRALALARAEVPRLSAVQVQADGALAGVDEPGTPVRPGELAEGSVVLLAQLLGLLEAFIGERLTLQMLHDVWPNLTLNELYFSKRATK
jgi:hypothetical protein